MFAASLLNFTQHGVIWAVAMAVCAVMIYMAFHTVKTLFKAGWVAGVLVIIMGCIVAALLASAPKGPNLAGDIKKEIDKTPTRMEIPKVGDFGG